jgi:hypothetical protein
VSLALWAPTFRATFDGDVDLLTSTFRWVVAFGISSVGLSILANLLHAYRVVEAVDDDEVAEVAGG